LIQKSDIIMSDLKTDFFFLFWDRDIKWTHFHSLLFKVCFDFDGECGLIGCKYLQVSGNVHTSEW